MDDSYLQDLSKQFVRSMRSHDPADPAVIAAVESTVARVRRMFDHFDRAPDPGPQFPSRPPYNFSDADAERLEKLMLARLP